MRRSVLMVGALVLLPAASAAAQERLIDRVVDRGHDLALGFYASLDDACRSLGTTAVELLGSPAGGSIYTQRLRHAPVATTENPQPVCAGVRVPGTRVFYRPAPGFVGRDAFHLRVTWPDRRVRVYALAVEVR